jgi:hypothetical protein
MMAQKMSQAKVRDLTSKNAALEKQLAEGTKLRMLTAEEVASLQPGEKVEKVNGKLGKIEPLTDEDRRKFQLMIERNRSEMPPSETE